MHISQSYETPQNGKEQLIYYVKIRSRWHTEKIIGPSILSYILFKVVRFAKSLVNESRFWIFLTILTIDENIRLIMAKLYIVTAPLVEETHYFHAKLGKIANCNASTSQINLRQTMEYPLVFHIKCPKEVIQMSKARGPQSTKWVQSIKRD